MALLLFLWDGHLSPEVTSLACHTGGLDLILGSEVGWTGPKYHAYEPPTTAFAHGKVLDTCQRSVVFSGNSSYVHQ